MNTFTLSNQALEMTFDGESGTLCGLTARETGWKILNRPSLGLSFQLLVPMRQDGDWHSSGGPRNNRVLGEKQRLREVEIAPDGRRARLAWEGLELREGRQARDPIHAKHRVG